MLSFFKLKQKKTLVHIRPILFNGRRIIQGDGANQPGGEHAKRQKRQKSQRAKKPGANQPRAKRQIYDLSKEAILKCNTMYKAGNVYFVECGMQNFRKVYFAEFSLRNVPQI